MVFSFVKVAEDAGFSTGSPGADDVDNWGQIVAKQAGLNNSKALDVTSYLQGVAVRYGIEKYHSGTPNSITVASYSGFDTQIKVDAFKFIIDNNLEDLEGDAITQAQNFDAQTKVAAMKFIVEHKLLAPASIIAAALLYTDNTKLLALITNQNHSVASVKPSDPKTDAIRLDSPEWDDIVEQYKHQIRSGDNTKLISPNVAVFGEDALDLGKGLVELTTTTKTSIVAAINELVSGGGFVAGNGLTSSGPTINVVSANTAIVANPDNIELSLKTTPGLEINSGLGILLDTNSGLELGAGGLSIGNGNGLSASAGKLNVNLANNSGLAFATNQLTTDLRDTTPGLELVASGLGVKVDDFTIDISSSTGNLRSTLLAKHMPYSATMCAATNNAASSFINLLRYECTDTNTARLVDPAPSIVTSVNARLECLQYLAHIANGVDGTSTVNIGGPGNTCNSLYGCSLSGFTTVGGAAHNIKTMLQGNTVLSDLVEAEICAQYSI